MQRVAEDPLETSKDFLPKAPTLPDIAPLSLYFACLPLPEPPFQVQLTELFSPVQSILGATGEPKGSTVIPLDACKYTVEPDVVPPARICTVDVAPLLPGRPH